MRAIIIDDEKLARKGLQHLLKLIPDIQVIAEAANGDEGIEAILQHTPDLIFLDINMPEMNGFEMLAQLERKPYIIFTTAHSEYALEAIQSDAVDYLLKPVDAADLLNAIDKVRKLSASPQYDMAQLAKLLQPQQQYREKFLMKIGQKYFPVSLNDIAYFFAEDKNVFAVSHDGRKFIWDESLDKLEPQLDPEKMYRANRQFIISHKSVEVVHAWFKGKLKLLLKPPVPEELIVSAEKAQAFKSWMGS
jgi:two-component system LytT family response regulator